MKPVSEYWRVERIKRCSFMFRSFDRLEMKLEETLEEGNLREVYLQRHFIVSPQFVLFLTLLSFFQHNYRSTIRI